MTSRLLVRESCDSPEGSRLYFVGDSGEHANRHGMTLEQYFALAGRFDELDIPPERRIGRYSLILEDLNRAPGDTVIGGAFMAAARGEGRSVDIHLLSAFMREEYRRKGLGSFAIGRPLGTALTMVPATNLLVHNGNKLDFNARQALVDKGFRETEDGDVLSLRLPGETLYSRFDDAEDNLKSIEAEIVKNEWSGVYKGRVYRYGRFWGRIEYAERDEDIFAPRDLIIYDAEGAIIDTWETDDVDVNWSLSAAIKLLNPVER